MPTEFQPLASYTEEQLAEIVRLNPHTRLGRGPEGELLVSSALDEAGAKRIALLCMQLAVWHGEYRAGELFDGSTGFAFGEGALLFADAAWVERNRWKWLSEAERCAFPPVCPSVVFDMVLPGDAPELSLERAAVFLAGGAKVFVCIDIERRLVAVHRVRGIDAYDDQRDVRISELSSFMLEAAKIFA